MDHPKDNTSTSPSRSSNSGRKRSLTSSRNVHGVVGDQETSLLAAIGSTITAQSAYETKVLRDASFAQVPQLTGVGFPDLNSLCPSYNPSNNGNNDKRQKLNQTSPNISHMVTVFKRIQNELDEIESKLLARQSSSLSKKSMAKMLEENHVNKLRMKKQMLLHYFASYTDLQKEDIEFDPSHDSKMEQARKNILLSVPGLTSSASAMRDKNNYESMMERSKNNNTNLGDNQRSKKSGAGINTKRLEEIKQNKHTDEGDPEEDISMDILLSKSKNASFGKHQLESQSQSRKMNSQNRKTKMMSLKKQIVQDSGAEWVDPEILYQKRLERRQRRKARRNIRNGKNKSIDSCLMGKSDVKTESYKRKPLGRRVKKSTKRKEKVVTKSTRSSRSSVIDVKAELIEENKIARECDASTTIDESDNTYEQNAQITSKIAPKTSTPSLATPNSNVEHNLTVVCPMSNKELIVPAKYQNDIDSFLAQHLHSYLNNTSGAPNESTDTLSTVRRSSRRSNLRSTARVNYNEDAESFDHCDEKVSSVTSDTKISAEKAEVVDNDIFDQDDSSSSDDSCEEKIDDDNDDDNVINDINPSSKAELTEVQYIREKTIDDFEEDDYEDRVDDWIINGIKNMRQMKEQDDDEQKPGAVRFPGGLNIPAWVNDRLFGYQRTALRWMWELRLQGAGGIVGKCVMFMNLQFCCNYVMQPTEFNF